MLWVKYSKPYSENDYSAGKIAKIGRILPTKKDLKDSAGPIARGSILGFFIGILPGAGATLASFFSYILEKKISKNPESFGKGNIAGVAAPESANNAASGGAMIPFTDSRHTGIRYNSYIDGRLNYV